MRTKRIIGAFEKVSFPDFGLLDVVAKIDTGATSGSLHATHIKEIMLPTGEKALTFTPYGKRKKMIVNSFELREVRSSNGSSSLRYFVPTTIIIKGVQYPIEVSLADRTLMKKAVLVGRHFLRSHGFVVDPNKGTKYRYHVK
ncbi:MAG TPA: RimK/LysX family protein [Candidatus Saccharimonadales bacterium]|nr:RimK/LysX family protein [Candidatus Saccharimonadales bacterium]